MNKKKTLTENIVRQVLLEYLDKDWMMPLKRYMYMDDADKCYDICGCASYILDNFIDENYDFQEAIDELIEKGIIDKDFYELDSFEKAEQIGDLFGNELSEFSDRFLKYAKDDSNWYDYHDMPLYLAANFERIVKNEWMVHMTDNLQGIYREGFNYGVDIRELAYTPGRGTTKFKYGPGYNFAFNVGDANHAEETGYGQYAILFQASGIEIYHWGDEENQIIFYGPTAHNIITLALDNEGMWVVESEITGRPIGRFNSLEDACYWCIRNFPQYGKHLVGKVNQRVRMERYRNNQKNNQQDYKIANESIVSKKQKHYI